MFRKIASTGENTGMHRAKQRNLRFGRGDERADPIIPMLMKPPGKRIKFLIDKIIQKYNLSPSNWKTENWSYIGNHITVKFQMFYILRHSRSFFNWGKFGRENVAKNLNASTELFRLFPQNLPIEKPLSNPVLLYWKVQVKGKLLFASECVIEIKYTLYVGYKTTAWKNEDFCSQFSAHALSCDPFFWM